ncbi:MAG: hypothetical protein M3O61_11265 [Gemmatimonadota bacterium]|nr:hypothetical protein [Gemmatimonadota bacterium]
MDELFLSLATVQNPGAEQLSEFSRDVEKFLNFVVDDREAFGFLWEHDPTLHAMAAETLAKDIPFAVGALRDAIPRISPVSVDAHGLRGRALRFKFNVIASLARRWEQVKGKVSVRGWFRQMVDAIDAVLDSLVNAAGGAGGLLKEFKDALSALAPSV